MPQSFATPCDMCAYCMNISKQHGSLKEWNVLDIEHYEACFYNHQEYSVEIACLKKQEKRKNLEPGGLCKINLMIQNTNKPRMRKK